MSGAGFRVPLHWRAVLHLLRWLPQGLLSRGWGRIAEIRLPRAVQGAVNRGFARLAGVDLAEAELPPESYPSLSAFFVRRLQPGVRRWPGEAGMPGSPVDGILGSFGKLQDGIALQAKGVPYRVADLLSAGEEEGGFESGLFFTIYLSPRHYHRIHAPVGGSLRHARAVPGRLFPVNLPSVHTIPELFPRNERLIVWMSSGGAEVALAAVGAYNVGRITADFDPAWKGPGGRGVTNLSGRPEREVRDYEPPLPVARGQELMAFHLGSTVVLLLAGKERDLPRPSPELREGLEVELGTPLLATPLDSP